MFDHINIRFQFLKWGIILAAIAIPILVYLFTSTVLELNGAQTFFAVGFGICASTILLHAFNRYREHGFDRYYASGSTWKYVSSRFAVTRKPDQTQAEWKGLGQLERVDTAFTMEAAVTREGLYVNIISLGRLLFPWDSVISLSRKGLTTKDGSHEQVVITLDGPAIKLTIPWSRKLEDVIPRSVGIS